MLFVSMALLSHQISRERVRPDLSNGTVWDYQQLADRCCSGNQIGSLGTLFAFEVAVV